MTRLVNRDRPQRGQMMPLFALALVILLGLVAFAVDGSYGFVQNRRAQNAADFAAFATSRLLKDSSDCNGFGASPSMQQVVDFVQSEIDQNSSSVGTSWTGTFLDGNGNHVDVSPGVPTFDSTSGSATAAPQGACGVSVKASPQWTPFLAGILGTNHLSGNGGAQVTYSTKGTPFGIISLNPTGPHAILGVGTGTFTVAGNVFVNSLSTAFKVGENGYDYIDTIDAKETSNLYVYGTMKSVNPVGQKYWPLDWCFGTVSPVQPSPQGSGVGPAYSAGDPGPPGNQFPTYNPSCRNSDAAHTPIGTVKVGYNNIDTSTTNQITDPLKAPGSPTNPFALASIACPGQAKNTVITQPTGGTLNPGEYTQPIHLTSTTTFNDCPNGHTGIYLFDAGLWIDPQGANATVTGNDIVIGTKTPYNKPGNVSGSGTGNGGSCLTSTTTSASTLPDGTTAEAGPNLCAGTANLYGVKAFTYAPCCSRDATAKDGTGDNFSLMIGGASGTTVTMTGPTSGGYGSSGNPGLVFYQDPATPANYGFDSQAGDGASVNINGVVYNASLPGAYNTDIWDTGTPFYPGGTLQAGYGANWTNGPAQSTAGSLVKITGTAIVDDFNTGGQTTITIIGEPYQLPGSASPALIG